MVEHIINTWFNGVRADFIRWIGWKTTTVQRRAEAGTFTAAQQKEILEKSDKEDLGIKPADFFPARLPQYNPENSDVALAASPERVAS